MQTRRARSGFTLIELLVVIAIIAVLIGLLLPAVQKVRESAARTQSLNNAKQLGLSLANYETSKKTLPGMAEQGSVNTYQVSALYSLLPNLEGENLYKEANTQAAYLTPGAGVGTNRAFKSFNAPADDSAPLGTVQDAGGLGSSNYAVNAAVFGKYDMRSLTNGGSAATQYTLTNFNANRTLAQITAKDGTSNTAAFAEKRAACGAGGSTWSVTAQPSGVTNTYYPNYMAAYYFPQSTFQYYMTNGMSGTAPTDNRIQAKPTDANCNKDYVHGLTSGGVIVGFCDGGATLISDRVNPDIWWKLSVPDDGFVVSRE